MASAYSAYLALPVEPLQGWTNPAVRVQRNRRNLRSLSEAGQKTNPMLVRTGAYAGEENDTRANSEHCSAFWCDSVKACFRNTNIFKDGSGSRRFSLPGNGM